MSAKTRQKIGRTSATGKFLTAHDRPATRTVVIGRDADSGVFKTSKNSREQARLVKAGLPADAFVDLANRLGSTRETLSRLTNIPTRTLNRRIKDGVFQQDEGERVLRVERVFQAAVRLFSGDPERAKRWLNSPDEHFDGTTPLEFSDTEPGALYVLDVIGRLEHGVFG